MTKEMKYKRGPLELDAESIALIQGHLAKDQREVFKIPDVMDLLVRHRISKLTEDDIHVFEQGSEDIGGKTIEHNKSQLLNANVVERPRILINALLSIDYIAASPHLFEVLSVGPRIEAEIFQFAAAGFMLDKVRGLDLMSYSEYIDLGDMHDMPYEDDSFDIVSLGWVLGYSANPKQVADEVCRVCRPGGYVAVACTRPVSEEGGAGATYYYKVDDILQHFDEDQIHHVYLRHETSRKFADSASYVMTVFELK